METAPLSPSIPAFDNHRQAEFENRFIQALNESGMLQLVSLGHRYGLFDHMADGEAAKRIADGVMQQQAEIGRSSLGNTLAGLEAPVVE